MVLTVTVRDYALGRYPSQITIWIGLWDFQPILATTPCPSTGLPNAKGKPILSTLPAKYNLCCSAAAPCKAHRAIMNDKYFPKVGWFFSLHYKDTTLCLHKQAKRAVHSWLGELARSLSDLWARGWKCLGCLVGKEKKEKKNTSTGTKGVKTCLLD